MDTLAIRADARRHARQWQTPDGFLSQFQTNGANAMNTLLETPGILDVPDVELPVPDLTAAWMAHFAKAICRADGLAQIAVPPREPILGAWFKEGDLGFICGVRGPGKTWLAMLLGRRCAEGGSVTDWTVHKPRRVLYVDGEMALRSHGMARTKPHCDHITRAQVVICPRVNPPLQPLSKHRRNGWTF
jgi:hypothetical protein